MNLFYTYNNLFYTFSVIKTLFHVAKPSNGPVEFVGNVKVSLNTFLYATSDWKTDRVGCVFGSLPFLY